jgi:hypothetical protein
MKSIVHSPKLPLAMALVSVMAAACFAASPSSAPSSAPASHTAGATGTPVVPFKPGIAIRFEEVSQFELTLPSGRRIYIDVGDVTGVEKQPTANDVLLTTVMFAHHYDAAFATSFPGQKLVAAHGELKLDDMRALSFDASSLGGEIDHQNPTDQMILIEAAGLRILACGDVAQEQLTADQLASIGGHIDVALCPIKDIGNNPDPTGQKMFNVLNQIRPRLLLPTHVDIDQSRKAAAQWKVTYADKAAITVTSGLLPTETTMLFLGSEAANYGAILKLTPTTSW